MFVSNWMWQVAMANLIKNVDQSMWLYSKILPYITCKMSRCGNEVHLQCPFCNEAITSSHPNTAIRGYYYIMTQTYHCFRCGYHTSALKLYEKLSGYSYKTLMDEYMRFIKDSTENKRGLNLANFISKSYVKSDALSGNHTEDLLGDSIQIPDKMRNPLTDRGKSYLESRLIFQSPNLSSYSKFYSAVYKKKYEVVVIPWYIDGEEVYYQWRFIDKDVPFPKYGFPKGVNKKIYGIDNISTSFPYIICVEGVFDSLWIKNGVAIGGKSLTDSQKEYLSNRFPKHRIVYAFDNDSAGIDGMERTAKDNDSLIMYWKDVSHGTKDLNEFAIAGYKDYFFDEQHIIDHLSSPLQLKLKLKNPFK